MKTRHPLVLTARVADKDIEPFDRLREAHFPPDRNVLGAHLTMFHRLPWRSANAVVKSIGTPKIFAALPVITVLDTTSCTEWDLTESSCRY